MAQITEITGKCNPAAREKVRCLVVGGVKKLIDRVGDDPTPRQAFEIERRLEPIFRRFDKIGENIFTLYEWLTGGRDFTAWQRLARLFNRNRRLSGDESGCRARW